MEALRTRTQALGGGLKQQPAPCTPCRLLYKQPAQPSSTPAALTSFQSTVQRQHVAFGAGCVRRGHVAMAAAPSVEESAAIIEPADSKQDADSRHFAMECAKELDQTKCQDITVLHVAPLASWTSYMVFCTVFSRPQMLAAIARLERMVAEQFPDRSRRNQPGSSPWECLDFGDVFVHLFTAEQREVYDVEGFYAAAEEVELPWNTPVNPTAASKPPPASGKPAWTKQY